MYQIFVVSDGTGGTAEQIVRAALTQFPHTDAAVERRSRLRTEDQARQVVEEASRANACVVHTVVSKDLRDAIGKFGRLYDVETVDLLGPLLARLTDRLASSPSEKPGLFRELNKEYFRRIEAMEFAFRHDDGQNVHELSQAELVFVGVSRTFKTPLSLYFAFRGWLAGNVPMVVDLPMPPVLSEIPPDRVFGLTTNASRLAALRRVRHERFGGVLGAYADLEFVRRELGYARQIFRQHPDWRVLTVTDKSVEEIASEVLAAVRGR
jgi:regulator of PEP synthase PpsR (kinase-PPPase family)